MPAFERLDIEGGAAQTTLASGIGVGDNSVTVVSAAGWPDGSAGPFYFDIGYSIDGTTTYEKAKATGRTGTTITGVTRGVDGSAAASHSAGVTVRHIFTAIQADEANQHYADPALDHHTNYLTAGRHDVEARHVYGAGLGIPDTPAPVGTVADAGGGDDTAREDHVHDLGAGSIDTADLFAAGVVDAAAIADNLGLGPFGYVDGATTLTNDSPSAADSFEQWGTETVTLTGLTGLAVVVRGWLHGNLNGDSLGGTPRYGEAKIQVSLDGGGTWADAFTGIAPRGIVSDEGGETRSVISAFARVTGAATGDIKLRAMLKSDGTNTLFANGYLMADARPS